MADVPLITAETLTKLFAGNDDVVLARGIGGGTNALVSRTTDFTVDYHGNSYLDHRTAAEETGATVTEIDSYRLGLDVDGPNDLAESLLHGDGSATQWLPERGFQLISNNGRSNVQRADTTVTDEIPQ